MAAHRAARAVSGVLVAALAAVLVALSGGTALAYWISSGTGTGTATTGTISVSVTAVTGGNSTTLYPGGHADVVLNVVNPNAFSVHVVSIAGNGTVTAGCSPTGVSFTAPTDYTGAQFTLAANSTNQLTLSNAAAMDSTSASACQGKTFTIPVTVQVRR